MNSDSTMTYCPWRTYRISINALYFNDVQISRSGRTWSSHLSFSFFFSPFFFWINKSVAPWETFPTKRLCYKVLQNAMRYLLSRVTANWAGGPDCDLWIRQKQQCCVRACCWFLLVSSLRLWMRIVLMVLRCCVDLHLGSVWNPDAERGY